MSSGPVRSSCLCLCSGKPHEVLNRNLVLGYSKSCGCLVGKRGKVSDLRGQHGDYDALKFKRTKGRQPRTYWLLKCRHCGRKKWSFAGNIKLGLALRCPCQIRELARHNTASFWRNYVKMYVNGAKSRQLAWRLSSKKVQALALKDCHYCGQSPESRRMHWRSYCVVPVNGLDRLDNTRGYTPENTVPCCKRCNRMKLDLKLVDFVEHCAKVARYQSKFL